MIIVQKEEKIQPDTGKRSLSLKQGEITLPKLKPEAQKKSGPTRGHIAKSGQGPGSPGAWQDWLSHDYSTLVQHVLVLAGHQF